MSRQGVVKTSDNSAFQSFALVFGAGLWKVIDSLTVRALSDVVNCLCSIENKE